MKLANRCQQEYRHGRSGETRATGAIVTLPSELPTSAIGV